MKIRLLIFDDEVMIRKIFKIALQDKGYEILDFDNPSICPVYLEPECNCPLNTMCADIIVTDIRMPEVNGLDFIRKQKEKGCKVKNILVISGYADLGILNEVKKLEAKFLRKPFNIDEFIAIINEFEKNIDPNRKLTNWDEATSS